MKFFRCSFIILTCFVASTMAAGQYSYEGKELYIPSALKVLSSAVPGSNGSGALIAYDNSVYFLTNTHVADALCKPKGKMILQSFNTELDSIEIELEIICDKASWLTSQDFDLSVLKIGTGSVHRSDLKDPGRLKLIGDNLIADLDVLLESGVSTNASSFSRLLVATVDESSTAAVFNSSAFALGFPSEVSFGNDSPYGPVIVNGNISGKTVRGYIITSIPSYGGNSGGPVYQTSSPNESDPVQFLSGRPDRLVGIMQSFAMYDPRFYTTGNPITQALLDASLLPLLNSGYSLVVPISEAYKLIMSSKN